MKKIFFIFIFIGSISASDTEKYMNCNDIIKEIKSLEKSYKNRENLTNNEKLGLRTLLFFGGGGILIGEISKDTETEVFLALRERITNLKKKLPNCSPY